MKESRGEVWVSSVCCEISESWSLHRSWCLLPAVRGRLTPARWGSVPLFSVCWALHTHSSPRPHTPHAARLTLTLALLIESRGGREQVRVSLDKHSLSQTAGSLKFGLAIHPTVPSGCESLDRVSSSSLWNQISQFYKKKTELYIKTCMFLRNWTYIYDRDGIFH